MEAVAVSLAAGGNGATTIAIGVSVARNIIGRTYYDLTTGASQARATVTGGSIAAATGVEIRAGDSASITARVLAAAVAVAASAAGGLAASVGGLWTDNTIATSVEASVTGASSVTTAGGAITVAAAASSVILADATAGAVSASLAASSATSIAVGLSLAHNTVDNNVYAGFGNVALVTTGGTPLSVTATDTMRIDVTSLAVAVSVAIGGGGTGIAVAGGGSESTNVILGSTIADISGGALGTAANPVGAVTVSASSTAAITATVVGVAGSIAFGSSTGVAVALGIAVARNFIGWGTASESTVGLLSSAQTVNGLATGARVQLAGERSSSSVSGARAGEIYQYLGASLSGPVNLTGQDYSDRTLWKQLGLGRDADEVRASLTGTSVVSNGALSLTATGSQRILATVLAGAVGIAGGGSTGVAVSGAGVYAENRIAADTRAVITGDGAGGITAASVALRATDASGIQALAGAAAVAVSLAPSAAISVAIALSIAFNEVSNHVEAAATGADQGITTTTGGVSALAEALGRPLFTFTPSGLVTAAGLDDAAVVDLDDTTTTGIDEGTLDAVGDAPILAQLFTRFTGQYALHSGWKLDVVRPGLVWKISDTIPPAEWATTPVWQRAYLITWDAANNRFQVSAPTIEVASIGVAFSAAFGGSLGLAISGAGAVAINSVLSTANAHIDDSILTSATGVALTATNDAGITATVVSLAAAIGASGTAGIGVAIGVSVARNLIGSTPDGGGAPAETQAYVLRSSIAAQTGELTATATSRQTISAIVLAGTAAVGAAGSVGIAAAGSGTWTENKIAAKIGAFIDGDGATGISATAVRLSATDDSSIGVVTASVALSFAFAGNVGVSLAIGVALAHNEVANQVTAAIRNAAHQVRATAGAVTLQARETAGIRAISAAAAIAVGAGFYAGIAIAGAGAEASNAIYTKVNAYLDASTVNAATTVSLSATDTSSIRAIVAAVSVSVGVGIAGIGVGIGVALATNTIGAVAVADYSSAQTLASGLQNGRTVRIASGPGQGDVYRYIGTTLTGTVALAGQTYTDTTKWALVARASGALAFSRDTTVTAGGAMTATATAGQTIEALTLAGTAVVSAGVVGIGLGGAGASTSNEIAALVVASVDGGSVTAASLALAAADSSTITTLTAAVGIAASFAAVAVSVAVAVALARNRIANDVGASVARATITTGTGALSAIATESATINATAGAAALAVGVGAFGAGISGAGADASNIILTRARASIDGSTVTAGAVTLTATDTAAIHALVATAAAGVGIGAGGVGASIGVSLARNLVGWDPTTGVAAGLTSDLLVGSLSAGQRVRIVAGPGAGDVYEFVGAARSGLIDLRREQYSDASQWKQVNLVARGADVQAFILGSTVTASGDLALTATNTATIDATVLAGSVAVGAGGVGVAISGAGVGVVNRIAGSVQAFADGGTITARRATLTAEDGSTIVATAGAAAIGLALGAVGVSISIGITVAYNEIATAVRASIANAAVTTTSGALQMSATSTAHIDAIAGAASIAVGVGVLGAGIAGAGAVATNAILTTTNAAIGDSAITSAAGVDLDAAGTATIRARILTAAAGVGVGLGGIGASIGVSIARNLIGSTPSGVLSRAEVGATIERSSVSAGGALTLDAVSDQTIEALVVAGSVAIAGGLYGFSAAGAGATTENRIAVDVKASVDGDGATGIQAAAIGLSARDTSRITATTGSVAVAASIAPIGAAIAIAVALGTNAIDNTVQASIANADTKVKATTGSITLDASETATITALTAAGALAISTLGSFSGGGAQATNSTTTRTKAFIAASTLVEAATGVALTAGDRSTISARLPVVAASFGLIGGSGAVSRTTDTIGSEIDAYIDGAKVTTSAGDVSVLATSNATVTADTLAIAVTVALGVAGGVSDARVFVNGHTQAYLGRLAEAVADAGRVTVGATSNSTATATVDGVAVSLVAIASMRGEAAVNTTTAAWVGDGSRIHARDADITATATNGAAATVASAGGGLVSTGDVTAVARDTSTVDAHVGQTTGSASTAGRDATVTTTGAGETLTVKAMLTSPVRASGSGFGLSLGVDISKIKTTAEATPTVRAYAGDRGVLAGAGDIELAANANTQVLATGQGVSGALGVAASGAEVTATLNPSVRAFTERTGSLSGRDVKLTATLNLTAGGTPIQQIVDGATRGPAYAKVTLGSAALLGTAAGAIVTVTNSPTIEATVGASTTVTATRDVAVTSNSFALAEADGRSLGIAGGIGIGTVVTLATAAGTVTTAFDGTLTAAASLTVLGTVTARSDATGRAVGGAILGAFTKPTIRATTNPTVNLRLGGNVTASGAIVAKSDVTSAANAIGSVFTVALGVALASVDVIANDSPRLSTTVAAGATITGGSISIGALHNYPYPASPTDRTRGAHASADVEGGGTISVGSTEVGAVAAANVDTTVAATANLRAFGTSPLGTIEIVSRSANIADARVKSRSGGVINVNIINPTATAAGPNPDFPAQTCANTGGCTTVSMLGNVVANDGGAGARTLSVLAEGEGIAVSNLDTKAGGFIQVTASSTARAISRPVVRTTIGSGGATIRTGGDLDVKAAGITDADSSAVTGSGGFVNVQSFSASASTQPNVGVTVNADARLSSGATITIEAVHNQSPPPQSDGTFSAPGAVDTSNASTGNKITFSLPHGLGSGDVVTYNAQLNLPGNAAIGGLTDGRQYPVIVTSPTALQFGAAFTSAQVDTTTDAVRFGAYVSDPNGGPSTFVAGAHNLLDGDSVYFFGNVGGLVSGQRYVVNVIDAYTLKLLAPGMVEKAVTLSAGQVAYDTATNVGTINAANTFAAGDAVTYHAPPVRSFGSGSVGLAVDGNGQPRRNADNTPIYANDNTIFLGSNPDANGVFQTGHGYQTGDQITYRVSGGNLVTVFGTAYTTPRTLWVIRIDQFRIRLADSLCHATSCPDPDGNGPGQAIAQQALTLNPDRSANGLRSTHSIVRANDAALVVGPALTPLVDGRVYFVVNPTAAGFQLAETPGGPAIGVRNGGLSGGPHSFAIEGVNLTSAGSGEQRLVLDLTVDRQRGAALRRHRRGRHARGRAVRRSEGHGLGVGLGRRLRRRQGGQCGRLGRHAADQHDQRRRAAVRLGRGRPHRQSRQRGRHHDQRRRRVRLDRQRGRDREAHGHDDADDRRERRADRDP